MSAACRLWLGWHLCHTWKHRWIRFGRSLFAFRSFSFLQTFFYSSPGLDASPGFKLFTVSFCVPSWQIFQSTMFTSKGSSTWIKRRWDSVLLTFATWKYQCIYVVSLPANNITKASTDCPFGLFSVYNICDIKRGNHQLFMCCLLILFFPLFCFLYQIPDLENIHRKLWLSAGPTLNQRYQC